MPYSKEKRNSQSEETSKKESVRDVTENFNNKKQINKNVYEEENKIFNDKTAFNNNINQPNKNIQEEFKNRDPKTNIQNNYNNNMTNSFKDQTKNPISNNNVNNFNENNNLINVNSNFNNKTYSNDMKLSNSNNSSANNPQNDSNKNMTNVNFKYDPMTNQIKDVNVKVDMDAETAYKLYQDNKKYLPTQQQVISGAKATGNFIQNSGILNEIGNNVNSNTATTVQQPKKKAGGDPLSNFFGKGLNSSSGNSDKNIANTDNKKGKF